MDSRPESLDGTDEGLFGPGWWVGSDGYWHTPDEDFDADLPKRDHPVRRVAVVLLAVALVGATTFGVWIGAVSGSGGSAATGPPLSVLTAQVRHELTLTGADGFGVGGVAGVICHPPSSWSPGRTFRCSVYGPGQRKIGVYDGTVDPTSPGGQWRWSGSWSPMGRPTTME